MSNKILAFLFSLCVLVACSYNDYDFSKVGLPENYSAQWVAPLVNSSISMDQLLKQFETQIKDLDKYSLELQEGEDHLYTIVYKTKFESEKVGAYYDLDDFKASNNLRMPSSILPSGFSSGIVPTMLNGQVLQEFGDTIYQDMPSFYGASLTEIILKSGVLQLDVSSDIGQIIDVTVDFVSLSKNGQRLVINKRLNNGKSVEVTKDLSGYFLNLNTKSEKNKVQIIVSAKVQLVAGQQIPVNPSINYSISLHDLDFSQVQGNLGKFNMDLQEGSIPLNIFEYVDYADNFTFVDPKLKLDYYNTVGVSSGLIMDSVFFKNKNGDSQRLILNNDTLFVNAHQNIKNISVPEVTNLSIDNTNSNIVDALFPIPNEMYYKVKGAVGVRDLESFWMVDTSKVRVEFRAELPLDLKIAKLVYKDTIHKLEWPSIEESTIEAIEKVTLKMITINGFPFEAAVQGYWLDAGGTVVDSLFQNGEEYYLKSAVINSEGYPIDHTTKETYIEFSTEKYKKLTASATKYVYKIVFHTANQGNDNVKILSTHDFTMKMGVITDMNADLNELNK